MAGRVPSFPLSAALLLGLFSLSLASPIVQGPALPPIVPRDSSCNNGLQPRASSNCSSALFSALKAANFSSSDVLHLQTDWDFSLSYSRYNLEIASTPCAVVTVNNANDAAEAVKAVVASGSGAHVQGRSGGHSYANYGLGGVNGAVVIYLTNLVDYSYDNSTGYATIGTGFTLDAFTDKMAADNRYTAHGICPQVGVGGHGTIGGLGYSSRMLGSFLDQLVQVTMVVANGSIVTASDEENSDLFWAIRGAGASFGVITEMVVKTYELQPTTQYSINFELEKHADMVPIFAAWQQFLLTPDLDQRFSSLVFMSIDSMIIVGSYYGTIEEYDALGFEAALGQKPSNSTAVLRSGLGAIESDFQDVFLQLGGGLPTEFYAKSLVIPNTDPLSNDTITTWFDYMDDTDPGTEAYFAIADAQGGKENEIAQNATAYPHRNTLWMLQAYAIAPLVGIGFNQQMVTYLDGQNELIQNAASETLLAYAGYVDPAIDKTLYWGPNYPQLVTVKDAWDPNNVFANPQSVGAGLS